MIRLPRLSTEPMHWTSLVTTPAARPGWSSTVYRWQVTSARRRGTSHTVGAGFEFDWDSLTRLLVVVYAWLKGRMRHAAALHDHLYRHGVWSGVEISRREADLLMWDAMRAEGVALRHAIPLYIGVRAGGWWSWHKHRRARARAHAEGRMYA